ncbi:unnamed protein product [Phytophthora fragariaefolia]|uniref:Unnamed protein product n=1 Tax=Phytophthora fragariaefolia TaxID=1490495 RepID=A0A9W6XER1_9STRA|nr:unnamed protein product [Phytophthora fragariaefolia]
MSSVASVSERGSGSLTSPLMQAVSPAHAASPMGNPNREVKVWVRDVNGVKYSVKMPISSTFDDVMQKVGEQHGRFFQGIFVGYQGGRGLGGWNEYTTISQMLPPTVPADFNEEQYLRDNPIQPKFKVRIASKPKHLRFLNECLFECLCMQKECLLL